MRVILIGFMGSGKSEVARRLGDKLGISVVDTDQMILEHTGRTSVAEIFDSEGEDFFRELETRVIKELLGKEHIIVSTGGWCSYP